MDNISYFHVLSFSIFDRDNNVTIDINPDLKKSICDQIYPLNTNKDLHYDPDQFFIFLKNFSYNNPDIKYDVYYKYEYINHDHINTFQNRLTVYNGFIHDRLMG